MKDGMYQLPISFRSFSISSYSKEAPLVHTGSFEDLVSVPCFDN